MIEIMIKKAGRAVNVDETRFPKISSDYVFKYGLTQRLNDSIASLSTNGSDTTSPASADEMYEHVLGVVERLYAGEVRAARMAAPKTAEGLGRKMALEAVINAWMAKNKGGKLKDFTNRNELASQLFDRKRDFYMTAAQTQLDNEAELADMV